MASKAHGSKGVSGNNQEIAQRDSNDSPEKGVIIAQCKTSTFFCFLVAPIAQKHGNGP